MSTEINVQKNNKLKNWMGPVSIGAVMFSTYVGPGFAAGTQTVQYFTNKGWIGVLLAPVIVGVLALFLNYFELELTRIYKPANYRQAYDAIYKWKPLRLIISTFKDIMGVGGYLIGIAAQIAASAALLNQLLRIPMLIGTVAYSGLILVLALWGAGLLRKVGTVLTICIVGVCIYIGITGIGPATPGVRAFLEAGSTPPDYGFTWLHAWYIIICFTGNFCCGWDPVIPACADVIKTRKDTIIAVLTNVVLCTLCTMIFTYIFAAGMPEISRQSLPTLWSMQNVIGSGFIPQFMYGILALAAMISTGTALIFAIVNRWEKPIAKIWPKSTSFIRQLVIGLVFVLLCTAGSSFGILNIIRYGFITMAVFTSPVLLLPLFITIPYRLWRDKKSAA